MAFINALLAFPGLLLALALLAVFGANKYGIILALGLAYTPSVTRIVRGTVMSLREKEFIESSRVLGNSELYTMMLAKTPLVILYNVTDSWAVRKRVSGFTVWEGKPLLWNTKLAGK